MAFLKLLPFFGPLLGCALGFAIAWSFVRHPNPETRRKRGEILLVLLPFVVIAVAGLLVIYLVSR